MLELQPEVTRLDVMRTYFYHRLRQGKRRQESAVAHAPFAVLADRIACLDLSDARSKLFAHGKGYVNAPVYLTSEEADAAQFALVPLLAHIAMYKDASKIPPVPVSRPALDLFCLCSDKLKLGIYPLGKMAAVTRFCDRFFGFPNTSNREDMDRAIQLFHSNFGGLPPGMAGGFADCLSTATLREFTLVYPEIQEASV